MGNTVNATVRDDAVAAENGTTGEAARRIFRIRFRLK